MPLLKDVAAKSEKMNGAAVKPVVKRESARNAVAQSKEKKKAVKEKTALENVVKMAEGLSALDMQKHLKKVILASGTSVRAYAITNEKKIGFDVHAVTLCLSTKTYPSAKIMGGVAASLGLSMCHTKEIQHFYSVS